MEHALWKGHLTFGLLNIPVSLYPAEKKSDLHFHLLDSRNQARVRYERINDETGQEVPWDKTVKAFEYDHGNYVVLKQEELEQVKTETSQLIKIIHFVNKNEINPIYFSKLYYLIPHQRGEKAYALMREALTKSHTIGIVKVVIRQRQHIAAVLPFHQALVLEVLHYNSELKPIDEFSFPTKSLSHHHMHTQEIELATQLINTMTVTWSPEQYHDEYQDALKEMIKEKIQHKDRTITKKQKKKVAIKPASNTMDFIDAIKRSIVDAGHAPHLRKTARQIKHPSNKPKFGAK